MGLDLGAQRTTSIVGIGRQHPCRFGYAIVANDVIQGFSDAEEVCGDSNSTARVLLLPLPRTKVTPLVFSSCAKTYERNVGLDDR